MAINRWLYPANPKIFDVFKAFETFTYWPVTTKTLVGDIIYIYVGVPYKQIAFKCEVLEVDVSSQIAYLASKAFIKKLSDEPVKSNKTFMLLKPLRSYHIKNNSPLSYEHLKANGLNGMLMGPRNLNNNPQLLDYIASATSQNT